MAITNKEFNVKHGAIIGSNNTNYIQVMGSATNNAVSISALGGDTNISISLIPKGTGTVNVPSTGLNMPTGTANSILYLDSSKTFSTNANLVFDGTNVGIGTSNPTYKLHVVGSFAATSKSFLIDHPTKSGMKLRYGSLESPYHGVRLTGQSVIVGKRCKVELPEYIKGLCKQEGSQVQITNIKHGKILWVDAIVIDENYFIIGSDNNDEIEYHFYWSFTAIRKDIDDMIVEF